jgi:hypothetical protein
MREPSRTVKVAKSAVQRPLLVGCRGAGGARRPSASTSIAGINCRHHVALRQTAGRCHGQTFEVIHFFGGAKMAIFGKKFAFQLSRVDCNVDLNRPPL